MGVGDVFVLACSQAFMEPAGDDRWLAVDYSGDMYGEKTQTPFFRDQEWDDDDDDDGGGDGDNDGHGTTYCHDRGSHSRSGSKVSARASAAKGAPVMLEAVEAKTSAELWNIS